MNSDLINEIDQREEKLDASIRKNIKIEINNSKDFLYRMNIIKYILIVLMVIFIFLTGFSFYKNSTIKMEDTVIPLLVCVIFYQGIIRIVYLIKEKNFLQKMKSLL